MEISIDDDDPIPGLVANDQLVEVDVVGESHRQDALERIAGARTDLGKHHPVGTTLRCDPKNEHDANAIRVECMGQLLGYIPRATAALLAPPLNRHGGVAEAVGVIVGGWDNGESVGSYGVRIWLPRLSLSRIGVDPESVRRDTYTRSGSSSSNARGRIDTGLSDAWATDEDDESYDLSWYDDLPEADRPAIAMLRGLLAKSSDVIDRHFQFAELEHRLYRCRDLYDEALDEFDEACALHDSEMDGMRAVFMEKWGRVPRLALYRQMAIRKSKVRDYDGELWWAERGLAVYGDDAVHEAAVEDLIKRRNQAHAKLNPPPKAPRSVPAASPESHTEELVCLLCGMTFERVVVKGRKPHLCPDCRAKGHDAIVEAGPATPSDAVASTVATTALDTRTHDAPTSNVQSEDQRTVEAREAHDPAAARAPAKWHPDPTKRHELRYWNGTEWTHHVADAGVQAIDPI
jgi:hypothetical protein